MSFFACSFRAPNRHLRARIFRAAAVTALVPVAIAALLIWLVPEGCGVWISHARHRWTCLLPGLMLVVPPVMALLLTMFTILNQRLDRPYADGWLVTVLSAGTFAQVLFTGIYLLFAFGQGYFGLRIAVEVFSTPQPFVAGAIAGAVYWITLWGQRRSVDPMNGKG
jgi:hypothetical protein